MDWLNLLQELLIHRHLNILWKSILQTFADIRVFIDGYFQPEIKLHRLPKKYDIKKSKIWTSERKIWESSVLLTCRLGRLNTNKPISIVNFYYILWPKTIPPQIFHLLLSAIIGDDGKFPLSKNSKNSRSEEMLNQHSWCSRISFRAFKSSSNKTEIKLLFRLPYIDWVRSLIIKWIWCVKKRSK